MKSRAASTSCPTQHSCPPSCFYRHSSASTFNKNGRPGEESAVTTAATGIPPVLHERAVVSLPHSLGFRAEGRAPYKERPHAGTHGLCVGPSAERDAQPSHVEGADVIVTDRPRIRRGPASRRSTIGHERTRVQWNCQGVRRRPVRRRRGSMSAWSLDRFAARRRSVERLSPCRPTPGPRAPLPGRRRPMNHAVPISSRSDPASAPRPPWRDFSSPSRSSFAFAVSFA